MERKQRGSLGLDIAFEIENDCKTEKERESELIFHRTKKRPTSQSQPRRGTEEEACAATIDTDECFTLSSVKHLKAHIIFDINEPQKGYILLPLIPFPFSALFSVSVCFQIRFVSLSLSFSLSNCLRLNDQKG